MNSAMRCKTLHGIPFAIKTHELARLSSGGKNMNRFWSVTFLGLVVLLTGCSPISVRTDYDREVEFANYGSFKWMPVPKNTGKKTVKQNSFLDRRIRRAVTDELEALGYDVKTSGSTDALLAYHIVVENHIDVNPYGYRYWGPRYRYRRYKEGAIIVDIVDHETKQLIWRGVASGEVGYPRGDPEQIKVAVAKIFENYPPQ